MPFRKRKRAFKRSRRTKRRGGNKLATKAFVKKQIRKDEETKYYDTSIAAQAVDYNGFLAVLTSPPQGTTDVQRIGDKLTLRAMKIWITLNIADATNFFRVIVFQWMSNTQLFAPTVGSILPGSYVGSINVINAQYTHDYRDQSIILYDRTFLLTAVSNPIMNCRIKVPLKWAKKQLSFGAATQLASNHIYMLLFSDSAAIAHPTVNYITRIWYDDA